MDPSLLNFPGPSNYHYTAHPGQPQHPGNMSSSAGSSHMHPASHTHQQAQYSSIQIPSASHTAFSSSPGESLDSRTAPTHPSPSEPPRQATGSGTHPGPLVEPHQDLNEFLESFWTKQMDSVEREEQDGKVNVSLPLARIKKVMKSDEEVKMISAEVPIMFSKACEVFISELTCRAWLVAEAHKRRTLQKTDVAAAIAHSDMFDFLIDIVPRDGEGGDANGDGGESKAQSVADEDGQEDGDEGEELYKEFVEGDE